MKKAKRVFIINILLATLFTGIGYKDVHAVAEEDMQKIKLPPDHHAKNGFRNIYNNPEHGLISLLRWKSGLAPVEAPAIPHDRKAAYVPDIASPNYQLIHHPDKNKIQITWIGHSTFLIQTEGINILMDPIFNGSPSPFLGIGPRRKSPPGIPFDLLPPIHAILQSHNHYDHLDSYTVKKLGNYPRYFVPLKLGSWYRDNKINNYVEMDWWDRSKFKSIGIVSVPIQHFSSRSLFDLNKTLWSGWVVETKNGRIFFAGDTGYSPHFREIRDRLGPMRLALLPIGAYRPRWVMKAVHMDPPEALSAHRDLQAEQSIAQHWGTFRLTDEPLGEPPQYLKKVMKESSMREDAFLVMKFGETLVIE